LAQALLSPERDLDLATLDRTFTLQFHDAVTTAIGADLVALVHSQAPGVGPHGEAVDLLSSVA